MQIAICPFPSWQNQLAGGSKGEWGNRRRAVGTLCEVGAANQGLNTNQLLKWQYSTFKIDYHLQNVIQELYVISYFQTGYLRSYNKDSALSLVLCQYN